MQIGSNPKSAVARLRPSAPLAAVGKVGAHGCAGRIAVLVGDRVGRPARLQVLRGGAPLELTVTVGERT